MIADAWPEPLLAAVHLDRGAWDPRLATAVAGVDPAAFCVLARSHAALPAVAAAIARCGEAPIPVRVAIAAARRAERIAQEQIVADLVASVRRLNAAGVASVACKGPALGVIAYGDACGRAYRDADVLVRARDLARAQELVAGGVDVADRLVGLEDRPFDAVLVESTAVDLGEIVVAASRADHLRLAAARLGGSGVAKIGHLLDVARLIDGQVVDSHVADEPNVARAIAVAVAALGARPLVGAR